MKAVILAAGLGIRLKPITNSIPKCLIKIRDKTLLEHSLNNLKQNGINEVLIVVGYLEELIKKHIGTFYNGMKIRYVENKNYSTTGHAYSLYLTKGLINDGALLIEGDLLYGPDAIKFLLDHPAENVILITELSGSGDEVLMYVDGHDNLSYVKHPQKGAINLEWDASDKDRLAGELVGLSKFSKDFLNKVYEETEKAYVEGNKNQYYEEAVLRAAKSVPVKCFLKQLVSIEIDNETDLNKAKEEIYPKLKWVLEEDVKLKGKWNVRDKQNARK